MFPTGPTAKIWLRFEIGRPYQHCRRWSFPTIKAIPHHALSVLLFAYDRNMPTVWAPETELRPRKMSPAGTQGLGSYELCSSDRSKSIKHGASTSVFSGRDLGVWKQWYVEQRTCG